MFLSMAPTLERTRRLVTTLEDITVVGSHASLGGGGVFLGPGAELTASRSAILGCSADRGDGGGLAVIGAFSALLRDVLIQGNDCSGSGGGMLAQSSPVIRLDNVTVVRPTVPLCAASTPSN